MVCNVGVVEWVMEETEQLIATRTLEDGICMAAPLSKLTLWAYLSRKITKSKIGFFTQRGMIFLFTLKSQVCCHREWSILHKILTVGVVDED